MRVATSTVGLASFTVSHGNQGLALAAHAARAEMRSLILLDANAPTGAVEEMRLFGAEVVKVIEGDVPASMAQLWREHGWYLVQCNAPGAGMRSSGNPFGLEGYKTIAYEIFRQLGGGMHLGTFGRTSPEA